MIIILFPISLLSALEVNIVMKDGSVVKKNMLGITADEIYLQDDNGKAKILKISDIKAVFNAGSGEPIQPAAPVNGQTAAKDNNIIVEEVPFTGVYYGYYNYYNYWDYTPYPGFYAGPRWFGPHHFWHGHR